MTTTLAPRPIAVVEYARTLLAEPGATLAPMPDAPECETTIIALDSTGTEHIVCTTANDMTPATRAALMRIMVACGFVAAADYLHESDGTVIGHGDWEPLA